jgi:hypothetical protein
LIGGLAAEVGVVAESESLPIVRIAAPDAAFRGCACGEPKDRLRFRTRPRGPARVTSEVVSSCVPRDQAMLRGTESQPMLR